MMPDGQASDRRALGRLDGQHAAYRRLRSLRGACVQQPGRRYRRLCRRLWRPRGVHPPCGDTRTGCSVRPPIGTAKGDRQAAVRRAGDLASRGAGSWRTARRRCWHLAPGTKEDTASCQEFFEDMRRRGLPDPLLAASDGAPGMIRAIEECLPRSICQRCLAHKMRNLQSKVPEDVWPEFKARAAACYQAASPALARLLRDDIATTYRKDLPAAMMSGRRPRGLHCTSAFPARPSASDPHHQSARATVRRGAPAHQSHPACLWRARRPEACLRRTHPRRRTLARHPHHRVRAASTEGNPRSPAVRVLPISLTA